MLSESDQVPRCVDRVSRLRHVVIGLIVILCIMWRFIVAFWIVPAWQMGLNLAPFPDHYPELAQSLLEDGELGYGPAGGATPTTVRGPAFPMWLALGIAVGGKDGRWLGFWSSLPIVFLAPIFGHQVWARFGRLPAIGAMAFLLFHPLSCVLSARTMSDEFYAACGFAAILCWDASHRVSRRAHALLLAVPAGLALALQMLTRSSGLLFLLVLLVVGVARRDRRAEVLLAMSMVALLPALVWSVRSSSLEGRPVFVHSLVAYNFWIGEGFERYGYSWTTPEPWSKVVALLASKGGRHLDWEKFRYTHLQPGEIAALEKNLRHAAIERITNAPLDYLLRCVRGLYRFWFQAQSSTRTLQYVAIMMPVLLLATLGVYLAYMGRVAVDAIFVSCGLIIILHNISYAAVFAMARFSVQVYPALAWILAVAITGLVKRE